LANFLGVDPNAVETAAKAFYEHPITATEQVAQQAYQHPETAAGNAAIGTPHGIGQDIVRDAVQGITDPTARLGLVTGMVQPNAEFGPEAAELESGLKSAVGKVADKVKAEWQPPKDIEKGIPSTAPVDTNIPLQKLSVSPDAYSAASTDNARGRGSRTEGPIRVVYNPDNGQYLVEDGMHRLVEAHKNGETEIPAKLWSGYSDVSNVHGDKMDLSPDEPEEEEPEASPIKLSTDTLGVKWAENDEGIRVSIPKSVPSEDVQGYAQKKLDEQTKMQEAFKQNANGTPVLGPQPQSEGTIDFTDAYGDDGHYVAKLNPQTRAANRAYLTFQSKSGNIL
jgi:hypothetical protein